MVSTTKTALALAAALLFPVAARIAQAAPPDSASAQRLAGHLQAIEAPGQEQRSRMVLVKGRDLSGKVYKKLGLPSLQHCWDTCVREEQCTGARWGVIQGELAGLCLLLSGELSLKEPVRPKTDDGRAIQVIAGRKQALARGEGGT